MMYSEHTFSSWDSCAEPYSLAAISIEANKRLYACNMLEDARLYMHECLKTRLDAEKGRIVVANITAFEKVARLNIPSNCLRGEYTALEDAGTGEVLELKKSPGNMYFIKPEKEEYFGPVNEARFSGDIVPDQNVVSDAFILAPYVMKELILCNKSITAESTAGKAVNIKCDSKGWPEFVEVDGKVLAAGSIGQFDAANAKGISPRWTFRDVFDIDDKDERIKAYNESIDIIGSVYGDTVREEMYGEITFTQTFVHPSLSSARRILTVDTCAGTARCKVQIVRKYDFNPEIYYVSFDSPVKNAEVISSIMGEHFVPGKESLKGSCQDHFVTDGWALFGDSKDSWMISGEDILLMGFGTPHPSMRVDVADKPDRVFAQVFDSTWDTNFSSNACGLMNFTFDLAAGISEKDADDYALACAAEEVVYINV